MKPWYAANARDLLETRRQGLRPDGAVAVSLDGGGFVDGAATTLYVHDDMRHERLDWRMLVNLDVWLCASQQVALQLVVDTASRIAHVRPADLVLRFQDGEQLHDVRVGTGTHTAAIRDLPAVHSFFWCPLNCSLSPLGERLCWALLAKHPRWTEL